MDLKEQASFLKDEYLLLQNFYEDFDRRILSIKGWSATIAIAAIGAGFYKTKYLWLFASAASLVFWSLEVLWKGFQYLYAPRIAAIEKAFATNDFNELPPLQIYTSWFKAFREKRFAFPRRFRMGIVMFPHVITFIAGILLFGLEAFEVFKISR